MKQSPSVIPRIVPRDVPHIVLQIAILALLVSAMSLTGQPPVKTAIPGAKQDKSPDSASQPAFRIDQPGTITFTVGMVIKGKIEKPQVIIFLPKEKTYYRDLKFTHSFAEEIMDPLPFTPVLE
jgi:hypothetical protein